MSLQKLPNDDGNKPIHIAIALCIVAFIGFCYYAVSNPVLEGDIGDGQPQHEEFCAP